MDALPTIAVVVAVGARTPIGLDACQTGFLLRAGFPAMGAAPLGPDGADITFCRQTALPPDCVGEARQQRLAAPALDEALAALPARPQALLLAVDAGAERTASDLGARARMPVTIAQGGLAASLPDPVDGCILVGGVHSAYDPRAIAALGDRLYDDTRLDAILPGEAAAFVALASPAFAKRHQLPVLARLSGVGSAVERARFDNDLPAAPARAATAAVRRACAGLADARAGWVLSDLSFESWRMLEWQSVMVRCADRLGPPYRIDLPAHRIGSLGAAALPLFVAIAAEAFARGYAPAPVALLFTGSDAGERGALVVAAA